MPTHEEMYAQTSPSQQDVPPAPEVGEVTPVNAKPVSITSKTAQPTGPRPVATFKTDRGPARHFPEAIRAVIAGKKITNMAWNNPEIIVCIHDEQLMIFRDDDKLFHPFILSTVDLQSSDWIVLD